MAVVLRRNLGLVRALEGGEWTSDPNVHRTGQMIAVWVCCPVCESATEIASTLISRDGTVSEPWECPKCPAREWLRLDTWGELQLSPRFDTSDVESKR